MSDQREQSDRPQRPRPERTAPNRNPNELYGFGAGGDALGGDPISRSVGIGYKIVEQYLEHGRALAAGVAPIANERGDTGNPMGDLASRMMRHTADLFEVWFQMMDVSGAARPRPMHETPSATAHPVASTAAPSQSSPAPSAGVAVQIESSRPATVAVDLRACHPGATLVAHALRSDDETLPRISGVTVDTSGTGGPVVVRVSVPEGQPDGIYNGMIIDEATSLPVGTVSVRLETKGKGA